MRTVIASAAVLLGAAFMFVAALGVARMPDLFTRMQAATKASTVGVIFVMCGVAVAYLEGSVTIRAVLIAGFFLLTSPVAAHAIARSAHVALHREPTISAPPSRSRASGEAPRERGTPA